MTQHRCHSRSASRRHSRRVIWTGVRRRWRAPDDLGTALACFRRAIAAHRRLARLAPRFFDSAVVDRERRDQEDNRRWIESWKPAFLKVYGAEPAPLLDESPPLPPPRIQEAVECQLASLNLYFATGSEALRRFQLRHPHAVPNLSRVARLIEIASHLARLATGLDSTQPPAEPLNHQNALADLERIYGDPHD